MEGTFFVPTFGLSRYLPLVRQCYQMGQRCSLPDRTDFRNFTGVQEGVRGATVGSTDIEREDELFRGAFVGFARHSGAMTTGEVTCRRWTVVFPEVTQHIQERVNQLPASALCMFGLIGIGAPAPHLVLPRTDPAVITKPIKLMAQFCFSSEPVSYFHLWEKGN